MASTSKSSDAKDKKSTLNLPNSSFFMKTNVTKKTPEPLTSLLLKLILLKPTYCLVAIAVVLSAFKAYFLWENYTPPDTGIVYSKLKMQAILMKENVDNTLLYIGSSPKPIPRENEILIKVKAFGISRFDLKQRERPNQKPKNASPILGNEIAGVITEIGKNVRKFKVGDRVFGLVNGGGYAEYALIKESLALSIPSGLNYEQAASLPESYLTAFHVFTNLSSLSGTSQVLIHACAGGLGTASIHIAKHLKVSKIFATAGNYEKIKYCERQGANKGIHYQLDNFEEKILKATQSQGVDIIIDPIGASFWDKNLNVLSTRGTLALLSNLSSAGYPDTNLALLLNKSLKIQATNIYTLPIKELEILIQKFEKTVLPAIANKKIKPVVDSTFNWIEIEEAHQYLSKFNNKGKVVGILE